MVTRVFSTFEMQISGQLELLCKEPLLHKAAVRIHKDLLKFGLKVLSGASFYWTMESVRWLNRTQGESSSNDRHEISEVRQWHLPPRLNGCRHRQITAGREGRILGRYGILGTSGSTSLVPMAVLPLLP